ncbi:MAG: phage tail sheath subtilisin-like domain-containing protein [Bacteroidota bacterium]
MPVQPPTSYPGVYVQEVPSGVRTIAGVSTSIAAFLGESIRGPINRPILITSYTDFERQFGGLSRGSMMSYAVRQFFLNGGTQAVVIRLAHNAVAANRMLHSGTGAENATNQTLQVQALDEGSQGNQIEVLVTYGNPSDSNFDLQIRYVSSDNPSDSRTETFSDLSMNSNHSRYAVNIVNDQSNLVRLSRTTPNGTIAGLGSGTAISGVLGDVATLLDATHNRFQVVVNGLDPVAVLINLPADVAGGTAAARLDTLCAAIQTSVRNQANGQAALSTFTCAANGGRIVMTSGAGGENSYVEVRPSPVNDAAANLQLALGLGGSRADAVRSIRPREIPLRSFWRSGNVVSADITTAPAVPAANLRGFQLSLNGGVPSLVEIDMTALAPGTHTARMREIAARIQQAVRNLRPSSPAYSNFTCTVLETGPNRRFELTSGTRGSASSVVVSAADGDDFANRMNLLTSGGASGTQAIDIYLQGGNEQPVTNANIYTTYVGSRVARRGIYALESVDLFNLLCLPGINNPGILMEAEAYCRERRAFLIVDAPSPSDTPTTMLTTIAGASLPKSDHAAVYYPWVQIADPLNGGALRPMPPSGTIAGLYARIDATRGIWKAPAGTEATLSGVQGLSYGLTDRENGLLNPQGINCLRIFPDSGAVSWGARTLQGADRAASEWKYVPIRRLALFIEESLYRGLKWAIFEPNDEPLWAQIRLNAGVFMHNLFRQGAFQGATKKEAYFVKCDAETTTQADRDLGVVNVWIGFAPLKPAEFVILYLQQIAGQLEV